jgi:hypothetical protein
VGEGSTRSLKSKRGFTTLDTLHNQTLSLNWERLVDQPDIIKVLLPQYLSPGETTTLTINYTIKIPDSKFTGMGINDAGRVYLNHWNIVVAPFVNGFWQLQSNLNLGDYSGQASDYEITWYYPKKYYLISNLIETKNEKSDKLKIAYFNDSNRIQADDGEGGRGGRRGRQNRETKLSRVATGDALGSSRHARSTR